MGIHIFNPETPEPDSRGQLKNVIKSQRVKIENLTNQLQNTTTSLCMMCAEVEVLLPDFIPERPPLHAWWDAQKRWEAQVLDIVARADRGEELREDERHILESMVAANKTDKA